MIVSPFKNLKKFKNKKPGSQLNLGERGGMSGAWKKQIKNRALSYYP